MTTVVANLECMVADHRVTSEGAPCSIKKIHRIGDSLYGMAGEIGPAHACLHWLRTAELAGAPPDIKALYEMFGEGVEARSAFTLLVLSPRGLALLDGWGIIVPLYDKMYGIGTGALATLSLMHRGATPRDAIKSSPPLDECSGFGAGMEPEEEWLLPPELLKPKRRR